MKKEKPKTHQTTVRFTPKDEYRLRMRAAKDGLSKASWIRQLVLRVLGEK